MHILYAGSFVINIHIHTSLFVQLVRYALLTWRFVMDLLVRTSRRGFEVRLTVAWNGSSIGSGSLKLAIAILIVIALLNVPQSLPLLERLLLLISGS